MLFYRAALPLSSRTLNYAAGIIRRHLKAIGSRWRKLNPGQQALLVLAYLRKGETFAQLAAGLRCRDPPPHPRRKNSAGDRPEGSPGPGRARRLP